MTAYSLLRTSGVIVGMKLQIPVPAPSLASCDRDWLMWAGRRDMTTKKPTSTEQPPAKKKKGGKRELLRLLRHLRGTCQGN